MIGLRQPSAAAESQMLFDLTDRGLLLADGVFDTARVVGGRIIRRNAHEARLVGDAAVLGIEVSLAAVRALAEETLPQRANGALRITVTRGAGARGLSGGVGSQPTLLARFSPLDLPFPAAPVRLALSTIARNPTSPGVRHKTLSYTDNIMALREAVSGGADEALLLSPQGNVACASAANIFLLSGGRLVTPPVGDGAMPGTTRSWLLEVAPSRGLEAVEQSITPDLLKQADSLFLTNSLRIFQPVSMFDGAQFNTALPEALLTLGRELLEGKHDD